MMPVSDSLAARIVLILLVGLVVIQALVAAAMLSGPGKEASQFRLPLPQQVVSMIDAIEHADPVQRERTVAALNSLATRVSVLTNFPERLVQDRDAPPLARIFRDYDKVLRDREFRVDAQRVFAMSRRLQRGDDGVVRSGAPLRLLVRLEDGSVLQILPGRSASLAMLSARVAGVAALIGMVIAAVFVIAIRQTAKPVGALAGSARRFAQDLDTPDLPESGPREIRELAASFNEMKNTIRNLVAERTRMLAAIAHDMRTYLTRLELRTDFIDDQEQNEKARRDLGEMARLLDDTLLFARETTAHAANDEWVDVAATVLEICTEQASIGNEVAYLSDTTPKFAAVSAMLLGRVVNNLIDNAIRYGKCARVSVTADPEHVELVIDDDGPGIPEDQVARLLRPFERIEESRGRCTGGTGLGLAIVHTLVQKAGGTLDFANHAAGGLRCKVVLPRAA